jgi:GTP-binding protein
VERCSILVHLVDLSSNETPSRDAEVIERELELYSPELGRKPRLVVGSKIDSAIEGASADARAWAVARGYDYHEISAVVGTGIRELVRRLAAVVREGKAEALDA